MSSNEGVVLTLKDNLYTISLNGITIECIPLDKVVENIQLLKSIPETTNKRPKTSDDRRPPPKEVLICFICKEIIVDTFICKYYRCGMTVCSNLCLNKHRYYDHDNHRNIEEISCKHCRVMIPKNKISSHNKYEHKYVDCPCNRNTIYNPKFYKHCWICEEDIVNTLSFIPPRDTQIVEVGSKRKYS